MKPFYTFKVVRWGPGDDRRLSKLLDWARVQSRTLVPSIPGLTNLEVRWYPNPMQTAGGNPCMIFRYTWESMYAFDEARKPVEGARKPYRVHTVDAQKMNAHVAFPHEVRRTFNLAPSKL